MVVHCPICTAVYSSFTKLKAHCNVEHKQTWTAPFVCGQEGCVRTFGNASNWKKHVRKLHAAALEQTLVNQNSENLPPDSETQEQDFSASCSESSSSQCSTTSEPVSLDELRQLIADNAISVVASARADGSMTIKACELLINTCNDMVESVVDYLRCTVQQTLSDTNIDVTELLTRFAEVSRPLEFLATKQKQNTFFEKQIEFVSPHQYVFSTRFETKYSDPAAALTVQKTVEDVWQYVSIRKTLCRVLGIPEVFDLLKARKPRVDGIIEDFIDGSAYKNHTLVRNSNRTVVALQLYYDDLEIASALGPHTGTYKQGVFYFSIKNLPPYFCKAMPNVYLVALAKTQDLSIYGYSHVLKIVAEEIKSLETDGFLLEASNETLYATLAVMTGDNLARHTILGFQESFSANRFCSHCMAVQGQIQTTFLESQFEMRTREKFDGQLQEVLTDRSGQKQKQYGMKSRCPLLDTNFWHVTQNKIGDLLHDVLEGIGPFEVKAVLHHLVHVQKLFTLDQLNKRIVYFAYGPTDSKTKPVEIAELKSLYDKNDKKLGQRGLAFWCLSRLLPLMIGDLVPENNVYWDFLLEFRQVCDILFAQKWSLGMLELFRELYAEHQKNFTRLFPNLRLIPKHHFIQHYATFAESTGPPYKTMLAAEEMHGNYFKRTSGIMCNFKNVTASLARKHQISAYANVLSGRIAKNRIEVAKAESRKSSDLPCAEAVLKELKLEAHKEVQLLLKFAIRGQEYRMGNVIALYKDRETNTPIFGVLSGALSLELVPESTFLLVETLKTNDFDCHFYCYNVSKTKGYELIKFDSLLDYHPLDLYAKRNYNLGGYWVCPRYQLT